MNVENETIRLDGWEVRFVRVSFDVACFVHALSELRIFGREVRGVQRWVGGWKVRLGLHRCIWRRQYVFLRFVSAYGCSSFQAMLVICGRFVAQLRLWWRCVLWHVPCMFWLGYG